MKAVWTLLTLLFGALTVGFAAVAIQSATADATTSFAAASGIGDTIFNILIIAVCALATRACYRRAAAGRPHNDVGRRPWER